MLGIGRAPQSKAFIYSVGGGGSAGFRPPAPHLYLMHSSLFKVLYREVAHGDFWEV